MVSPYGPFNRDVLTKPYSFKKMCCSTVFIRQVERATSPSQAYSMESKWHTVQLNATQTLVMLVNKHTPNGWLMTIPKQRENPLDKMTSINWSLLM